MNGEPMPAAPNPFAAQFIQRIHEDAALLLQDYEELLPHLAATPEVMAFAVQTQQDLVQRLEMAEQVYAAALTGQPVGPTQPGEEAQEGEEDEEGNPEGDPNGSEDDWRQEDEPADEEGGGGEGEEGSEEGDDQGQEEEGPPGGGEQQGDPNDPTAQTGQVMPVDEDADTMDDSGVPAASGQGLREPTPEEALVGMQVAEGLDPRKKKSLKGTKSVEEHGEHSKYDEAIEHASRQFFGGRRPLRATSHRDMHGSPDPFKDPVDHMAFWDHPMSLDTPHLSDEEARLRHAMLHDHFEEYGHTNVSVDPTRDYTSVTFHRQRRPEDPEHFYIDHGDRKFVSEDFVETKDHPKKDDKKKKKGPWKRQPLARPNASRNRWVNIHTGEVLYQDSNPGRGGDKALQGEKALVTMVSVKEHLRKRPERRKPDEVVENQGEKSEPVAAAVGEKAMTADGQDIGLCQGCGQSPCVCGGNGLDGTELEQTVSGGQISINKTDYNGFLLGPDYQRSMQSAVKFLKDLARADSAFGLEEQHKAYHFSKIMEAPDDGDGKPDEPGEEGTKANLLNRAAAATIAVGMGLNSVLVPARISREGTPAAAQISRTAVPAAAGLGAGGEAQGVGKQGQPVAVNRPAPPDAARAAGYRGRTPADDEEARQEGEEFLATGIERPEGSPYKKPEELKRRFSAPTPDRSEALDRRVRSRRPAKALDDLMKALAGTGAKADGRPRLPRKTPEGEDLPDLPDGPEMIQDVDPDPDAWLHNGWWDYDSSQDNTTPGDLDLVLPEDTADMEPGEDFRTKDCLEPKKHRSVLNQTSNFFKELAFERAFGDKHREKCSKFADRLGRIVKSIPPTSITAPPVPSGVRPVNREQLLAAAARWSEREGHENPEANDMFLHVLHSSGHPLREFADRSDAHRQTASGHLSGRTDFKPGDLAYYRHRGSDKPEHAGIVQIHEPTALVDENELPIHEVSVHGDPKQRFYAHGLELTNLAEHHLNPAGRAAALTRLPGESGEKAAEVANDAALADPGSGPIPGDLDWLKGSEGDEWVSQDDPLYGELGEIGEKMAVDPVVAARAMDTYTDQRISGVPTHLARHRATSHVLQHPSIHPDDREDTARQVTDMTGELAAREHRTFAPDYPYRIPYDKPQLDTSEEHGSEQDLPEDRQPPSEPGEFELDDDWQPPEKMLDDPLAKGLDSLIATLSGVKRVGPDSGPPPEPPQPQSANLNYLQQRDKHPGLPPQKPSDGGQRGGGGQEDAGRKSFNQDLVRGGLRDYLYHRRTGQSHEDARHLARDNPIEGRLAHYDDSGRWQHDLDHRDYSHVPHRERSASVGQIFHAIDSLTRGPHPRDLVSVAEGVQRSAGPSEDPHQHLVFADALEDHDHPHWADLVRNHPNEAGHVANYLVGHHYTAAGPATVEEHAGDILLDRKYLDDLTGKKSVEEHGEHSKYDEALHAISRNLFGGERPHRTTAHFDWEGDYPNSNAVRHRAEWHHPDPSGDSGELDPEERHFRESQISDILKEHGHDDAIVRAFRPLTRVTFHRPRRQDEPEDYYDNHGTKSSLRTPNPASRGRGKKSLDRHMAELEMLAALTEIPPRP